MHRDLKPENILRLDGAWLVADFGIARYAEATTSPATHKFAGSPPYCPPERWRNERATTASDVYSLGVIAFEVLIGARPFPGPAIEDFRDQHLHDSPHGSNLPRLLASLIDECLFKAAAARPSPASVLARLQKALEGPRLKGLATLQKANQAQVQRDAEEARVASLARTEAERRDALHDAALRLHAGLAEELVEAIRDAAPAARLTKGRDGSGFKVALGDATITVTTPAKHAEDSWGGWEAPAFDVVAYAEVRIEVPMDRFEYTGRSHSLWYGDIQEVGVYRWFEVAFMAWALSAYRSRIAPAALDPGEDAAKAVWTGMAEVQLAWPFTPLTPGDLDDFVDRWAIWLAAGSQGQLSHPSSMPERPPQGSFRCRT
ncbi:MAG: serine/threonine-protein kinase [Acidimicrobiales bacterium]